MTEYKNIKLVAIASFVLTFLLGESAFYIILAVTLLYAVFRPSSYLILLFFSGLLKSSPEIRSFPVDFTLLTFILFSTYFLYSWIKGKSIQRNQIVVSILIGLIFGIVVLGLFLTPAPWNYISNSGIYIVFMYLPLLFMIINLPSKSGRSIMEEFQKLSLLISYSWIGLGLHNEAAGYFPPQLSNPTFPVSHLSSFGEDYMAFATFIVLVFTDTIVQFLYRRRYLVNGVLIIILIYALANSPARGLALGLLLSTFLLVLIWFKRFSLKKVIIVVLLSCGILAFILYYLNRFDIGNKNYLIHRLVDFDPSGTSINNRITSVVVAFQHWKDRPWFGLGTDSVAWLNNDPGLYTHNLILEIFFEYGIIGGLPLFALLALVFLSFYIILKKYMLPATDVKMIWFGAVFVVFFGFGMFSGTLGNMRLLWILIGMTIWFGTLNGYRTDEKVTT